MVGRTSSLIYSKPSNTVRVSILPHPSELPENNGIGRVVHAQYRHLPQFDIDLTGPLQAEVIAAHTQRYTLPKVDVLHLHGLYWTGDVGSGQYQQWHQRANQDIVESVRRARVLTVPSQWVGMPFKRDMRIVPEVIGHGIELSDWNPGTPGGYVLWNKNRAGDVCNPLWPYMLAEHGATVISTFAPSGQAQLSNLTVTGQLPEAQMKPLIQNASIYLATTKETFGIGTVEALACGVPVLAFNFGGQTDLIRHKENGYLARPYDVDDLWEGLQYIEQNRARMSAAARESSQAYSWAVVMEQYANLYRRVASWPAPTYAVSVVIPSYNYAPYVEQAIQSVLQQSYPCEIIVVDDGSTDDTQARLQASPLAGKFKYIRILNSGVAQARTVGIQHARGEYLICLDADDRLHPEYVQTCIQAFRDDPSLGVVYTGLGLLREDGSISPNNWPPEFSWEHMTALGVPPASCIHSAAMFSRKLWLRAGPHRQAHAPGEDTEFWVRGLANGFTARKVTDEYLFSYRVHAGSASRTKQYKPIDAWLPFMRDKFYPLAAPAKSVAPVRSYSEPLVAVILPIGPEHGRVATTAIESVIGQSLREWELIVVDDGMPKDEWQLLSERYPFINFQLTSPAGRLGPGAARNQGLAVAQAPLCIFLDADDALAPTALWDMVRAYKDAGGRYIYTDWVAHVGDTATFQTTPEYDAEALRDHGLHAVSVLMDTSDAQSILFDDSLARLEDWDFFIRCALLGYPGQRLAKALVHVRTDASTRTPNLLESDVQLLHARYGDEPMASSCCGGNSQVALAAIQRANYIFGGSDNSPMEMPMSTQTDKARLMFTGQTRGARTFGGRGITPSGAAYRGGDNLFEKYIDADPRDVAWLLNTGVWTLVQNIGQLNLAVVDNTMQQLAAQPPVVPVEPPSAIIEFPAPALTAYEKQLSEEAFTDEPTPAPVVSQPYKKGKK